MAGHVLSQGGVFIMGYAKGMEGLYAQAEEIELPIPEKGVEFEPFEVEAYHILCTGEIVHSAKYMHGMPDGRNVIRTMIERMMSSLTPSVTISQATAATAPASLSIELDYWKSHMLGNIWRRS